MNRETEMLAQKAYRACPGMNCGATDGKSHSAECVAEHHASVVLSRLIKRVQPGEGSGDVAQREGWNGAIQAAIDALARHAGTAGDQSGAAAAMVRGKRLTDKQLAAQDARYAIDAAITYGRTGTNRPPAGHWLSEYWSIGRQLAKLGETSIWDNQTPVDAPDEASQSADNPAEAQQSEAIYQLWDVDRLAWNDVQKERYGESQPSNRRTVYRAPADPTPFNRGVEAESDCKCKRLGDFDGSHHPLCDASQSAEPVALTEERIAQISEPFCGSYGEIERGDIIPFGLALLVEATHPAATGAQGLTFDLDSWMGEHDVVMPVKAYEELKAALAQAAPSASAQTECQTVFGEDCQYAKDIATGRVYCIHCGRDKPSASAQQAEPEYWQSNDRGLVSRVDSAAPAPSASPAALTERIEQLRRALFESRDAMRVMANWVKKSDPAGHGWAVHMVGRANAVLSHAAHPAYTEGQPQPIPEFVRSGDLEAALWRWENGHAFDSRGPEAGYRQELYVWRTSPAPSASPAAREGWTAESIERLAAGLDRIGIVGDGDKSAVVAASLLRRLAPGESPALLADPRLPTGLSQRDTAALSHVDELIPPPTLGADEVDAEAVNTGLNGAESNLCAAADADPHGDLQSQVAGLQDRRCPGGAQGATSASPAALTDARDSLAWAIRDRTLALPRYSFWLVDGGVRRVPDSLGRWIERDAAAALCDPEQVDAILAASPAPAQGAQEDELRRLRAIADEYDACIRHMDAGGDFHEFQRAAMSREQTQGEE
ncbi:hypothetical protein HTY52_13060 [Cupriavidus taiwanensis]|uniref:hypothetical protein n=1 Tax=Cupriavidus taiwanensis TaxID=164546 RepID=UPI00157269F0|nr:hypothetical protein [Cupriavidus taiwanensis]NSX15006.1 hypothetical protein [Cupriavidus taiwanensis]